jgi:hypothetical protein
MGFSLHCSVPPGQCYSFVNRKVHDKLNTSRHRDHEPVGNALKIPEPWPAGHPCSLKYHPIPSLGLVGGQDRQAMEWCSGYIISICIRQHAMTYDGLYIISCSTSGGYFITI